MNQKLSRDTKFVTAYNEAQRSADQSEAGGDVSGYDSRAIVVDVDSYTDGTTDFTVVVSDDGSTWSEADASQVEGSLSVDGSGKTGVHYLDYLGSDPYIGIKTSTSNTTSGATWGAYVIGTNGARQPVR